VRPGGGLDTDPLRVQVTVGGRTAVHEIPLEEYVRGAALAELALNGLDEASAGRILRVQTVVARTYAVSHRRRHRREGFDLCSTTHCQLFRPSSPKTSRWFYTAQDAVRRTKGDILEYERVPIEALFHANCGGETAAADTVWGGSAHPYLESRSDEYCVSRGIHTWQFAVGQDDLREALNGDPKTRVGQKLNRIDVVERDVSGRAVRIVLDGSRAPMVRGEEFRGVLMRAFGSGSIKSTHFDITQKNGSYTFNGRGHGHGVGMCQAGALGRAQAGHSPENILAFYYPGTRIHRLK
jgi:stage II sporulation protein D